MRHDAIICLLPTHPRFPTLAAAESTRTRCSTDRSSSRAARECSPSQARYPKRLRFGGVTMMLGFGARFGVNEG